MDNVKYLFCTAVVSNFKSEYLSREHVNSLGCKFV